MTGHLLEVEDLSVRFGRSAQAVRGVDFVLRAGEMLGIVGESGSGKSVSLRAIAGLLPPGAAAEVRGSARLDGQDLRALAPRRARRLCSTEVGFVFQDPLSSLNPGFTIGWQLAEALRFRVRDLPRRQRRARSLEALAHVELADAASLLRAYPHELSGGMRQRVMIAMALLSRPRVLFADEPTTALDVTLSAEILDLFQRLQREDGLAVVLVSHDLNLVVQRCERVLVMYAGRIVEEGSAAELFAAPRHPYTRGLLAASVDPFGTYDAAVDPIPGAPLGTASLPGCGFGPRCALALERCRQERPELLARSATHAAACHRADELVAGMRPTPALPSSAEEEIA